MPSSIFPTVREPAFRDLVSAGGSLSLIGAPGGFLVRVVVGDVVRLLGAARGGPRLFVSLDTACSFARELGAAKFEVDASDFVAVRIRKARPDRAEALRKTRTRMLQQPLV